MAVDKQKIRKILGEDFKVTGKVTISDTGLVSVTGDVTLLAECNELPVSFDQVRGHFTCTHKRLKTLVGSPRWVGGCFFCSGNQLEKLEGAPQRVRGGTFDCASNKLTSLAGAPRWVGDIFNCSDNDLKSLKDMPLHIGSYLIFAYNETLPLCEIITRQIEMVIIHDVPPGLTSIVEKYQNTGYSGILPFATELIRAGYGSNAWL
jgi:hypothetical protein